MTKRDDFTPVAEQVPFDNENTDFVADNVRDAIIEARLTAEGFPRAGIVLVNNGTQGNNDWISYSNLTPDVKIVFPVNTRLNEITFGNSRNDVEFELEFYKNGTAGGNVVYSWVVNTGAGVNFGYDDNIDIDFAAGDWIRIKYLDQGTNTSDLVVTLWISRIV